MLIKIKMIVVGTGPKKTKMLCALPLAQSMMEHEAERTACLREEGKKQMQYPMSNEGFFRTVFLLEGRALDWMFWPWLFVVLHATAYTVLQESYFTSEKRDAESWEIIFRCAVDWFQHLSLFPPAYNTGLLLLRFWKIAL